MSNAGRLLRTVEHRGGNQEGDYEPAVDYSPVVDGLWASFPSQFLWFAVLLIVSLISVDQVVLATSTLSSISLNSHEMPTCFYMTSDVDSGQKPRLSADERWLVFDDFKQPELPSEYQVHYGRGSYAVAHNTSGHAAALVYELRLNVQLAGEEEGLGRTSDESLGRPFGPSLLLARAWSGERWTFDTKITYGWAESCNGCRINLWIAFDSPSERTKNSIKLSRFLGDSNHGDNLTFTVFDSQGNPVRSDRVMLNSRETYFLRVIRNGETIEVLMGTDGASFTRVFLHSLAVHAARPKMQWMILNSLAFKGGCAYAALHYVMVRAPITDLPDQVLNVSRRWTVYGAPDHYIELDAEEIVEALRQDKDIDVRFASIRGELNFNRIRQTTIPRQIVFRDSVFTNAIVGSDLSFENDVICERCEVGQPSQLLNSRFKGRTDFSGSTFRSGSLSRGASLLFSGNNFEQGADFTGTTFQTKPIFRASRFYLPVSFWSSHFEKGGDFSDTVFDSDVTFTDFSFSTADVSPDRGPDMLFFGTSVCGRILLNTTFDSTNPPLGHEISFQGAHINEFVLSGGIPDAYTVGQQEGPAVWNVGSGLSLREAKVRKILLKDVVFTSSTDPVDLQGLSLQQAGPFGACRQRFTDREHHQPAMTLINIDFGNFLMSDWPVGDVLADERSAKRVITALESNNPALARRASFDLAPISSSYDDWRRESRNRQREHLDVMPFNPSSGQWAEKLLLKIFWITSGYGTNLWFTLRTGLILTAIFACIFLSYDRGRGYLIRIEKPLELKARISETPTLSWGETPKTTANRQLGIFTVSRWAKWHLRKGKLIEGTTMAVLFSINTILKVGFGNIRVRVTDSTPRGLVTASWLAWGLGYGWYFLVVYTVAVIPLLKGLVK